MDRKSSQTNIIILDLAIPKTHSPKLLFTPESAESRLSRASPTTPVVLRALLPCCQKVCSSGETMAD